MLSQLILQDEFESICLGKQVLLEYLIIVSVDLFKFKKIYENFDPGCSEFA